jgi:hypothetical protein
MAAIIYFGEMLVCLYFSEINGDEKPEIEQNIQKMERAPTLSRCHDVPMKGNNMTNQNQPGQQNQGPGQKPGQQQGGGPKPGQQSQAPGKGDRSPKEQLDQTSDTDT